MISLQSIRSATSLAIQGDFHSAIDAIGDRWQGVGVEPARNGESDLEYAELLLVCGILTVRMGHLAARAQDDAKDLLSKSARIFGESPERYAALFWLASAYSLRGEDREALTLIESILADQAADIDVLFSTGVLKALVHLNLGNALMAESSLASIEVFLETISPMCRGRFYLARGILHRQTRAFELALEDYRSAVVAFQAAGSRRYQAAAENNMAGVFTEQGRFPDARRAAESALRVFSELRDRAHEAKVWDQLAQIYGREQNYVEMCRCADRAVEILSDSDHEGWLAEALITQGTARARLGMVQAQRALSRALAICEKQGDSKQAAAITTAIWEIVCREKRAQGALRESIAPLERVVYEQVLEKHQGRISPAAHELGLHHHRFQKLLKSRFPDLLAKRVPIRPRNKSLMSPE